MKAILPLLILMMGLSSDRAKAQCQTVNGSFESWTDYTDYFEHELNIEFQHPVIFPTEWFSLVRLLDIALSNFYIEYLDKDTLDIPLFDGVSQYMPGANGTASAARLRGDSLLLAADLIQFIPCSSRPDKMTGYFKYEGAGQDTLQIVAVLHNGEMVDTAEGIGYAFFSMVGAPEDISRDAAEYTAFSADFIYKSDEIPDSVTILILTTKDSSNPSDTAYFVVDEIQFGDGSVSSRDFAQDAPFTLVPNPAADEIRLNLETDGEVTIQLYDALGREVVYSRQPVQRSLYVGHLTNGTYIGRITAGTEVFWQKIMISH